MPTLEESKVSFNEARTRMLALEQRLVAAGPDDDLDAIDAEITQARSDMESADKVVKRFDAIDKARDAQPLLTPDTTADGPQARGDTPAGRKMRAALNSGGLVEVTEPLTYRWDNSDTTHFFQDVYASRFDPDGSGIAARERLARHSKEMTELRKKAGVNERAMSGAAGLGGELVTPIYLNDQYVPVARVGRPFVNAVGTHPLPPNTNSINIPRLLTGTTEAAQTEGGAVASQDATTGYLTINVQTIAGQVDVSRQLLERASPGLDAVLFPDLVAAQNAEFDRQCVVGTGGTQIKGVLNASSPLTVTYTQASPIYTSATAGVGLYGRITDAIYRQIATNLFRQADYILMHPRRWGWIAASLDTSTRPIMGSVPLIGEAGGAMSLQAVNSGGLIQSLNAQGIAGFIQGLPVVIDANVPITQGDGTRDTIVVGRSAEYLIWEDAAGPYMKVFEQTLSGTLQIRLQAYTYVAATFERYPNANCLIQGSGLTTPVYQ